METKKAIQFILIFAISYIVFNGLYQYLLWLYGNSPDPITVFTATLFCKIFPSFSSSIWLFKPAILISLGQKGLVNIAEGCNGIAVISTFISFTLAFKSSIINYLKFVPIAIVLMLLINLFRIYVLVEIKLLKPNYFNVFHTYIFPAILYFIAFVFMVLWVKFITLKKRKINNEY